MSERKTSEIKLRVTPSFKAAVQLAAETVGETMSVYMEKATEDRMKSEKSAVSATGFSLEGEPQIGPSLEVFTGSPIYGEVTQDRIAAESATASPDAFSPALTTKFDWTNFPQPKSDDAWRFARQFSTNLNPVAPVAPTAVPPKSDKVACEKNCSPWQWCECKASNA